MKPKKNTAKHTKPAKRVRPAKSPKSPGSAQPRPEDGPPDGFPAPVPPVVTIRDALDGSPLIVAVDATGAVCVTDLKEWAHFTRAEFAAVVRAVAVAYGRLVTDKGVEL